MAPTLTQIWHPTQIWQLDLSSARPECLFQWNNYPSYHVFNLAIICILPGCICFLYLLRLPRLVALELQKRRNRNGPSRVDQGTLDIELRRATGLLSMDRNGFSDPFVVLKVWPCSPT